MLSVARREILPESAASECHSKALENTEPRRLFSLSLGESSGILNALKWLFSQGGVYKNKLCARRTGVTGSSWVRVERTGKGDEGNCKQRLLGKLARPLSPQVKWTMLHSTQPWVQRSMEQRGAQQVGDAADAWPSAGRVMSLIRLAPGTGISRHKGRGLSSRRCISVSRNIGKTAPKFPRCPGTWG